jgi:hypothetical protein
MAKVWDKFVLGLFTCEFGMLLEPLWWFCCRIPAVRNAIACLSIITIVLTTSFELCMESARKADGWLHGDSVTCHYMSQSKLWKGWSDCSSHCVRKIAPVLLALVTSWYVCIIQPDMPMKHIQAHLWHFEWPYYEQAEWPWYYTLCEGGLTWPTLPLVEFQPTWLYGRVWETLWLCMECPAIWIKVWMRCRKLWNDFMLFVTWLLHIVVLCVCNGNTSLLTWTWITGLYVVSNRAKDGSMWKWLSLVQ